MVVWEFKSSGKKILTGCTKLPSSNSPFCAEHKTTETPVIPAERLTANTRDILWKWQKENQKSNLNLPRDNCFTVERVNKTRKTKNQTQMLIKFSGYPADLECWEPVTNLPSFVVKHYSDKSKLGKFLPNPVVSRVQTVSKSEVIKHLTWTDNTELSEEIENVELLKQQNDVLELAELRSTCNTRKNKVQN